MINYTNTALSVIGIPVQWQLRPKNFPSITFATYYSGADTFGDGEEVSTDHYLQLDVWSKNDYTELVNQVIAAMKAAGFTKQPGDADEFEEETKVYHKVLKFHYLEEREV